MWERKAGLVMATKGFWARHSGEESHEAKAAWRESMRGHYSPSNHGGVILGTMFPVIHAHKF